MGWVCLNLRLGRRRFLIAAVIVLLAGYGLRLYRLGAANLWWDEAFSVWLARQPVLEGMKATARDVHPPLFYALLNGLIRLTGESEFAARYLSLLAGTATVALIFPLGQRLFGSSPAVLAALLLSLSRFHIWWSQEVRMYSLAAFWITLSIYLLLRQTSSREMPRKSIWLLYLLSVAAALHTLYLTALIIPASGVAVIILWRTGRIDWQMVKSWFAATIVSLLLYLPWILSVDPSRPGQVASGAPAQFILSLYLTLLSTGNSTELGRYTVISLLYGAMIASVLFALAGGKKWTQAAYLAPPLLLPPLLAYLLIALRSQFYTPALEARYFLIFTPLNALIPAAGVAWLSRRQRWAAAALATVLTLLALSTLPPHYTGRYLRDQWKSATRIIDAYAAPDDKLLIVSGDRYPLFLYEYERFVGPRPETGLLPDGVPRLKAENIAQQMEREAGSAERVWLVEIEAHMQDPEGLARAWLEGEKKATIVSEFDHNRLTLFAPSSDSVSLATDRLSPQTIDEKGLPMGVDLPVREFRPGDTIHLGVFAGSARREIRLVHESGLTLSSQLTPDNTRGVPLRHDLTFPVTQAAPRGSYRFFEGHSELVSLRITRSDPLYQEQEIPQPLAVDLGQSIQLLGFDLDPAGPAPGDTVRLDLYWRAKRPVDIAYTVFTQIIGPFNEDSGTPVWGQHDAPPLSGAFPTNAWPVDLIVRDRHTLVWGSNAPPATYSFIAGMYDPATGDRLPIPGNANDALLLREFEMP
jgi:hypothetical protein